MPKLCFMNLDQLQALRAIADEGSFEAAAYELGVSASAVSQRIRALEREVGQVLLRRGEVLAAVTTEPQPVQGCAAEPLGSMRYVPLASPALLARAVEDVRAGRLARVPGLDDVLVPLYWQAATLPVTRLVRLTRAVREAAQRTLERG